MISIFWLFLVWMAGWRWSRKLLGDPAVLLEKVAGSRTFGPFSESSWPVLLFQLAASLWIGLLPLTWITYLGAAFLAPVLPLSVHPLLVVNTLIMTSLGVGLVWKPLSSRLRQIRQPQVKPNDHRWIFSWASLARSLQDPSGRIYLLGLLVWLLMAIWLMISSFWQDGSQIHAGYSVFSDFAPHTALVSSFSEGRNWPTEYPHFANDGIAYHFMFFFLCGNLKYLGLPLDLAINLPSILGFITFCLLMGTLALRLTGRKLTWFLAPSLLFFRSSMAFFTFLSDLVKQYGIGPGSWPEILAALRQQSVYIGNTANDSWGLWGINVYANQRHLLPGLSIALIIMILLLPDLQAGLQQKAGWRKFLLGREFWLPVLPDSGKRIFIILLLCVLLPYFHGSALVALMLILIIIAIFSSNRLSFLAVFIISTLSALAQSRFFSGSATRVVQPAIKIGFIAPDSSLWGMFRYLLEMSGILLPLVFLVFWLPGRRRKIMLASFMLPLLFAMTISLTPDVTVNHKYFMICFAFCNIYIADFLASLWGHWKARAQNDQHQHLPAALICRRLAAIILAIVLTITGFEEMVIFHNINQNSVSIDSASSLVKWIVRYTRPDAVFVTAPYHYNEFYLSGRSTWLGHSYYAWSAGHDTAGRLAKEQQLVNGCGGDLAAVKNMIAQDGLDYLIIDDTLREHDEFTVDEAFFDQYFQVVAAFPQLGNLKIYNLRQSPGYS